MEEWRIGKWKDRSLGRQFQDRRRDRSVGKRLHA